MQDVAGYKPTLRKGLGQQQKAWTPHKSLDLRWQTYEHMAEQEPAEFQPTM